MLLFIYLLLKFLNAFIFYLKQLKGSEQNIVISQANRVNPCCARMERRITSQFSEAFIFEPIWLLKQRKLCRTSIMMKSDWRSNTNAQTIHSHFESFMRFLPQISEPSISVQKLIKLLSYGETIKPCNFQARWEWRWVKGDEIYLF